MQKQLNSTLRHYLVYLMTLCMLLINNSCVKDLEEKLSFDIKITNPFDFEVEVGSFQISMDNDLDFAPHETRRFINQERVTERGTVELRALRKVPLPGQSWNDRFLAFVEFTPETGNDYSWTVGDDEVYDGSSDSDNSGGSSGDENTGQLVFYSQANIDNCASVEVTLFRSLEEYYGTTTTPGGRGIIGKKSFTGVFPNQEATCSSANAAVFTVPAGRYYYVYTTRNCQNFGYRDYAYVEATVTAGQCTKVRVSR